MRLYIYILYVCSEENVVRKGDKECESENAKKFLYITNLLL